MVHFRRQMPYTVNDGEFVNDGGNLYITVIF